jgi:Transposase DDE domain
VRQEKDFMRIVASRFDSRQGPSSLGGRDEFLPDPGHSGWLDPGEELGKAQESGRRFAFLAINMDEPAGQRARELANTPEFAKAQRERKKVEALFAELKNQIGLRRLRLRRLRLVREQFFLAAAAQNLKRLVCFTANQQHPPWKPPLS